MDPAISPEVAEAFIRVVATSGAKWITFAGGDPSVRADLIPLIRYARSLGLKIELQTNADSICSLLKIEILTVDQVGLSLDGPTPEIHDAFRDRPGNFLKVTSLLSELAKARVSTVVRTVVASGNHRFVPAIAHILLSFPNVQKWSLLEFTPLGNGYVNRDRYVVSPDVFRNVVDSASRMVTGQLIVDGFENSAKAGTYALVSPSGRLYGTETVDGQLRHRFVGNMLTDHLSDLAAALPFNPGRHQARYGNT